MSITRVQRRYITLEIVFEQVEEDDTWQVVDIPELPFSRLDWVSQEEIDANCDPNV